MLTKSSFLRESRTYLGTMSDSVIIPFFGRQNLFNACLLHLVASPILYVGFHVVYECPIKKSLPLTFPLSESLSSTSSLSELTCRIGLHHPLLFVNIVMFFFVCVVFWVISLYQKSTWLIGETRKIELIHIPHHLFRTTLTS